MSAEKLAFLQNFYTDVTLYVPAETTAAPAVPAKSSSPVATKPARPVSLPPTGFSHPSAGLERLASAIVHPIVASEQPAAPPQQPAAAAERPAGAFNQSAAPSEHSAEGVLPRAAALPPPAEVLAVSPVMRTQFTTLGNNAQGVVLLFRLPQEQFRKLHRNVFLNKMLQALSLVMADVVLVNVESELPVALVNLRRELAATHIVAFGKNLLDSTIRNTQIYEPVQLPSLGLSYLSSATVDLVEYDTSLKKRLWPGLQRMFLG